MSEAWNTGSNSGLMSRDEAKAEILDMARGQGIEGAFKVFYKGALISSPESLPEQVNINEIRVSAVLDQAANHWFVDGFGELTTLYQCV